MHCVPLLLRLYFPKYSPLPQPVEVTDNSKILSDIELYRTSVETIENVILQRKETAPFARNFWSHAKSISSSVSVFHVLILNFKLDEDT